MAPGADGSGLGCPRPAQSGDRSHIVCLLYLLTPKGIYIMENLYLEELAHDRRHVFAFIGIPLKFRGATGSPLRPLALVSTDRFPV